MNKLKITHPAAKGYKLCNLFFTRFREIGKIPFSTVCDKLKHHELEVVTNTKQEIPIDTLLREYTQKTVTVEYIEHHIKIFTQFINLDIKHLADNIIKMLNVYRDEKTEKRYIRTYLKYIQCVSCLSIMSHCFNEYLPANTKLNVKVPISNNNVCPVFKHMIRSDIPANVDDKRLLQSILLYRLITTTLHYIHTTAIIATNSNIDHRSIGKPSVEIVMDHKKIYSRIMELKKQLDTAVGTTTNTPIHKHKPKPKPKDTAKHNTDDKPANVRPTRLFRETKNEI